MNDIARESLLYDFYGSLLTDKKRSVMECSHEDDMSLGEIADEMGISRAAVHDSLKSAEAQLEQYEEKLGLRAKYEKAGELADEANAIIADLQSVRSADAGSESKISGADNAAGTAAKRNAGMTANGSGADLKRLREIIAALAEPGS